MAMLFFLKKAFLLCQLFSSSCLKWVVNMDQLYIYIYIYPWEEEAKRENSIIVSVSIISWHLKIILWLYMLPNERAIIMRDPQNIDK